MKRNVLAWLVASVFIISLLGCSDSPTSASTSNYRKAVQSYFDNRDDFPYCVFREDFPMKFKGEGSFMIHDIRPQLAILTELNLVDSTIEKVKGRPGFFEKPTTHYNYQLTEKGKKYYTKGKGICIGKPKLLDLKDVSEPFQERGKTYVRGTYTWSIELPEWALNKKFANADAFRLKTNRLQYNKLTKGEPLEDSFTLTLNDSGWTM